MINAAALDGNTSGRRREGYAVHIEGLRAMRGERAVLHDVLLAVPRGQVWALMGVSGAGKSTLLRTVAGLEPFDRGRIVVEQVVTLTPGPVPRERYLRALREHVGFVFQQHALFAHLSVLDNVTLAPRHVRGLSRSDAESRAMSLLEDLGVGAAGHAHLDGLVLGHGARRESGSSGQGQGGLQEKALVVVHGENLSLSDGSHPRVFPIKLEQLSFHFITTHLNKKTRPAPQTPPYETGARPRGASICRGYSPAQRTEAATSGRAQRHMVSP